MIQIQMYEIIKEYILIMLQKTYFISCGTSTSPLLDGFIFRNGAGTDILNKDGNGTIIGNGTALTNLNYNAILNKPTLIDYNNPAIFMSTLNVSGITVLNNDTIIKLF